MILSANQQASLSAALDAFWSAETLPEDTTDGMIHIIDGWMREEGFRCPPPPARAPLGMTQNQSDIACVTGWRDAARQANELAMLPFYERIIAALSAPQGASR